MDAFFTDRVLENICNIIPKEWYLWIIIIILLYRFVNKILSNHTFAKKIRLCDISEGYSNRKQIGKAIEYFTIANIISLFLSVIIGMVICANLFKIIQLPPVNMDIWQKMILFFITLICYYTNVAFILKILYDRLIKGNETSKITRSVIDILFLWAVSLGSTYISLFTRQHTYIDNIILPIIILLLSLYLSCIVMTYQYIIRFPKYVIVEFINEITFQCKYRDFNKRSDYVYINKRTRSNRLVKTEVYNIQQIKKWTYKY